VNEFVSISVTVGQTVCRAGLISETENKQRQCIPRWISIRGVVTWPFAHFRIRHTSRARPTDPVHPSHGDPVNCRRRACHSAEESGQDEHQLVGTSNRVIVFDPPKGCAL